MSTATFSPTFDIETVKMPHGPRISVEGLMRYTVSRTLNKRRIVVWDWLGEPLAILPGDAPLVSILWAIYEDVMGDEA